MRSLRSLGSFVLSSSCAFIVACGNCGSPPALECITEGECPIGETCVAGVCATNATPAVIVDFTADRATITSGVRDGARVQGTVTLTWSTQGATTIALFDGITAVDLTSCVSLGDADSCAAAGSIAVAPQAGTTYTLVAGSGDVACELDQDGCTQKIVDVQVRQPAAVSLSTTSTLV